jgi:hypothetical protein
MPMLPRRGDAPCAIRIEAWIAVKGAAGVSPPRPGSNASWGAYGYAGDAGVNERKFHLRHTVSRRRAADPTNQGSLPKTLRQTPLIHSPGSADCPRAVPSSTSNPSR